MELCENQNNQIDQTPGCSFHTEDEFSIINRPDYSGESLLKNTSYSDNNPESSRNGTEYLYTSYSALFNAFEHLKGNLRKIELENLTLRKQIPNHGSTTGSIFNSENTMNNHENDVTKAWEAYSIKLKECEQLRDELREAENKLNKLQNSTKPQSLREDAIRAQTFQEEMKKSLQHLELEKRDLKNKENLAREELIKEKEYHESVLRATEQKHHAMESEISDLQQSLKDKDSQTLEIKKEHDSKLFRIRDLTQGRERALTDKISALEGKVIREQEERGRVEREKSALEEKVSRLSLWRQKVERLQESSGLPIASFSRELENGDHQLESDIDPLDLINEIELLSNEILSLKQHTTQQSLVISRICEDPRIYESLMSMSLNTKNIPADLSKPVQCTEVDRLKEQQKNTSALSSLDTRSVIDETPGESEFGSHNNINGIILNRKIHTMEPCSSSLPTSPHRIEVPPDGDNLSTAFTNLRVGGTFLSHVPSSAVESEDEVVLPLATNRLQPTVPPGNGSLHSDPGTTSSSGSSNTNTIELIAPPPHESTSIRYPPNSNQSMKAIWPETGHAPIWPPDTDPGPSFDVIAALPNNSSQLHRGIVPADDQPPNRATFQPKSARDNEALRVAAQRERTSHQSIENQIQITRPRNRAARNTTSQNTSTRDPSPLDHRLRDLDDESIDVITDDGGDDLSTRLCPMCGKFFDHVNVRFMERHVNSHFNDDATVNITNSPDSSA